MYITKLSLTQSGHTTVLTMTFNAEEHGALLKLISAGTGGLIKGSTKKALHAGLVDIKAFVERH